MNIKQIRAALAAATPGPWELVNTPERGQHITSGRGVVISTNTGWKCFVDQNDVRVIASAPQWLAALCDEVERLEQMLKKFVDAMEGEGCIADQCGCHLCEIVDEARKMLEEAK
jgi:hypothetical protein